MKTVGIIGLGLIGGSIARALKHKKPEALIIAYNRSAKTLEAAKNDGVIDHFTKQINETFSACDIIFLCLPVNEIPRVAEQLKKYVSKNTIVTDVGSTKNDICDIMKSFENSFTFIGGHPMAGSELSGYTESKHYLFENAYYILTPYENTPESKLQELTETVKAIGALPLTMDAGSHDFVVGAISHLPHVVAMSLVNTVREACIADDNRDAAMSLASGGFKDITRIASSSPKMWNDISLQNKQNILKLLEAFKCTISKYEALLTENEEKSIFNMFDTAKSFRNEFKATRRPSDTDMISVDIEDKPGGIAFVSTILAYNNINIKNIGISNSRDTGGILEIILDSLSDKIRSAEILRKNGLIVHE